MPYVFVLVKKAKWQYKIYMMVDRELTEKIKRLKKEGGYTLYELSKRMDIQVATLQRWLKTGHINRLYAKMVRQKLGIE